MDEVKLFWLDPFEAMLGSEYVHERTSSIPLVLIVDQKTYIYYIFHAACAMCNFDMRTTIVAIF